jgi:hypothetical protein
MEDVGIVAKEWFEANSEDLAMALLRCFFRGAIVKHPDFVLMGEPCRTEGGTEFVEGEPDTWFVHYWGAMKGKFTCFDAAAATPFYLPYIAFKRRGKLRVRRWEQFLREPIRSREYAGLKGVI